VATPKQLVTKIAELTGFPEGTVIVHDRNLMAAGLRSPGVRGRGTSAVTFEDAVNLLLAVIASRNVKDSAKTVLAYKELPADAVLDFGGTIRGITFGDALCALAEGLVSERDTGVDVFLYGPHTAAKIEIDLSEIVEVRRYGNPPARASDLEFITKFSQATLGPLGELVARD
jgi:hypothetical protein